MKRIAIEEHFTTKGYQDHLRSRTAYPRIETMTAGDGTMTERLARSPKSARPITQKLNGRLLNLGPARFAEMDRAGIDMQVVMLAGPGVEDLMDIPNANAQSRDINDELAAACRAHPDRLAGFATLSYGDPKEAAKELQRCVTQLGLKATKINSHVDGEYLDGEKYWPLFEAAENLDVPIYIHPKEPPKALRELLGYPVLGGAMWGFQADVSLHALRLMCGGVFERFPKLKIILGHLGEGIPFWLWRIDNIWSRSARKYPQRPPGEYFRENFYVTTSGMFGRDAFDCVYRVLGADRILYAVDYPYEIIEEGAAFMDAVDIPEADKAKICHLNAEKLLKL